MGIDERLIPFTKVGRVAYSNDEYGYLLPVVTEKVERQKRIKPSAWALVVVAAIQSVIEKSVTIDRIIRRNVQRIQQINLSSSERNQSAGFVTLSQ